MRPEVGWEIGGAGVAGGLHFRHIFVAQVYSRII